MGYTCHYKSVNQEGITLTVPSKISSKVYRSNIEYSGNAFYLQTPEIVISKERCFFKIIDNPEFFNVLSEIEETVIDFISDNAELFFKGRTFTKEQIAKSMEPILLKDSDSTANINLKFSDNVKYTNSFNDTNPEHPEEFLGRCILHIDSVIFTGSTSKINISVCNVKISVKTDKTSKIDYCVLTESPILEPVNTEIILESDFFLD